MNKSIVIPGILCAGFASASGYLWQEMRAQRERADELQDQVAELRSLQKAQPATTYAPSADEPEITATAAQVTQAPATSSRAASMQAAPAVNAIPRNHFFSGFEQQQRLLQDPEFRKLMLAQQRTSVAMTHPDLISALGLSREQADRLFDLLAEQQMRSREKQLPMQGMTGPPDEAALQEMQRQAKEEQQSREAEVAALLGDAKMAEWKEYRQSISARFQVKQLHDLLAGSDAALREDQMQPLVAAIAQEQRRDLAENGFNMKLLPTRAVTEDHTRRIEESIDLTSASNQRIHDAAAAILSSDQLDSLDEMLNQNLNMQRMHLRMLCATASEDHALLTDRKSVV